MDLTIVGCSGSYPGPTSAASSYLLSAPDASGRIWRVVLDLGSGALSALQQQLDIRADIDAVLLSHLHADHCLDMCGLYVSQRHHPDGPNPRKIPVWGPEGTADRLARAYDLADGEDMCAEFDFSVWKLGEPVSVGPFLIEVFEALHPVQAYSMRVTGPSQSGGSCVFTYTGDTDECPGVVAAAQDADVLLAESSFLERHDAPRGIHFTGVRAGKLAQEARVGRLLLTHIPPSNDPKEALIEAKSTFDGSCEYVSQGFIYSL